MPLRRRRLLAGLLVLAALPPSARAAHPHYERLLREGTFALERGDASEAARDLRLACFGFLDEPQTLADCLTRLALAQLAAGDDEGFGETFGRVVEVEERFDAYSQAPIPPELRAGFEAEVAKRIPSRILLETPVFARLVPPPEAPGAAGAAPATSVETPAPPPAPPPAETGEALTLDDAARLARARELLTSARTRADLEEPSRLAREVADAHPGAREAQHLAAVIAYRAARWEEAVRYFRRGGDPDQDAAEVLFYFAVSLYESGEREDAAEVLRRSLPRIEETPFVRSYRAKILGEAEEPSGGGELR